MTLAAGIAYFAALAFFPSFAAMFAIATMIITPEQAAAVIQNVNAFLPSDIAHLVTAQLDAQGDRVAGSAAFALVAIIIALFGASAAVENTFRSLNIAYGVVEKRNLVKLRALSMVTLVGVLLFVAVVMVLLVIGEYMVAWGVPKELVWTVAIVRWPLLLVMVSGGFALLYQYGPDRPHAKWRWVSWGAGLATGLWFIATLGLFVYTRYFTTFSAAYTLFAGIVVLMVWFNFSALALLIGAHVNRRLERR